MTGLLIAGAVVAGAGVATKIVGFFRGNNAAKNAESKSDEDRRLFMEAVAEFEAFLGEMGLAYDEIQAAMKEMNDAYEEGINESLENLIDILESSLETFEASVEERKGIMTAAIAAAHSGDIEAINTFIESSLEIVEQAAEDRGKQIGMTSEQLAAISAQMKADVKASIETFSISQAGSNAQLKEMLLEALATYDAEQSSRDQKSRQALAVATDEAKAAFEKSTAIREAIIGTVLNETGILLENTNKGVAEILGITPEENLDAAKAAAKDFAAFYTEAASSGAAQAAQQAARQAGMTKGQAAMTASTAAANAAQEASVAGHDQGLAQHRLAQEQQTRALEEEYARNRDYAQMQIDEAHKAEQADTDKTKFITEMERQNVWEEEKRAQEESNRRADLAIDVAIAIHNAETHTATTKATMEQNAAANQANIERQNAADIAAMSLDATNQQAQQQLNLLAQQQQQTQKANADKLARESEEVARQTAESANLYNAQATTAANIHNAGVQAAESIYDKRLAEQQIALDKQQNLLAGYQDVAQMRGAAAGHSLNAATDLTKTNLAGYQSMGSDLINMGSGIISGGMGG